VDVQVFEPIHRISTYETGNCLNQSTEFPHMKLEIVRTNPQNFHIRNWKLFEPIHRISTYETGNEIYDSTDTLEELMESLSVSGI